MWWCWFPFVASIPRDASQALHPSCGWTELAAEGMVAGRGKLAHACFFFVFAFLLSRYVSLPITLVIALAMLIGAADEIHQSFLPGRVAGWDDWLADVVGASMGLICVFLLGRRKSLVE